MTTIQGREYDELLLETTERLIQESASEVAAGQIIAAMARAKLHVRHGYAACNFDPPPADEYVALVAGLAKQELLSRAQPVATTAGSNR